MSTARSVTNAMKRHHQHKPEPITDPFAQAVARKLESRGITSVPGIPVDEPPQWFDLAIEQHRRQQELKDEREARRKADEKAQEPTQTTASILLSEIARAATGSGSATIPLNGAAVLRAALTGGSGTVNGLLSAS